MLRIWRKGILCLLVMACILSFSVQAKVDLDKTCPNYSFTTINGGEITNSTNVGKTTLIVFLQFGHDHGQVEKTLSNLMAAEWIGNPELSVIVSGCFGDTIEDVRQKAVDCPGIAFCNGSLWEFMEAAEVGNSFSFPISFVVDKKGTLQGYMMGESSDLAFRELLHKYVKGIEPLATADISITGESVYSEAFAILEILNARRAENGLPALKMDEDLLEAAMLRAAECNVYYSHTRPNGTSCFTAFPSQAGSAGENIAIGHESAQQVMEAWMNSSGHRANILSDSFSSAGIGVFAHNGVCSWVQLFSSNTASGTKKPADAERTFSVEALEENIQPNASTAQMKLSPNTTRKISVSLTNAGFPYHSVFPDGTSLSFRSDNPNVAKVNAQGVVTAVAPGKATITAAVSGTDKRVTVSVEVGEHNYTETVEKWPTCAEPGIGLYVCEDCGDTKTEEIPKLTQHTWDDGVITKQPTVQKEGIKTYTCDVCAATKTEKLPKLPAPQPTQPLTTAPTVPATKAPTAAPTVPATEAPTVPQTATPTTPTVKPTAAPTIPETQPTEATMPAAPTAAPTEPTAIPTQMATDPTEPTVTDPSSVPEPRPAELVTRQPDEYEDSMDEDPDSKLLIGIVVAVVATLAAACFLIFWKRKN